MSDGKSPEGLSLSLHFAEDFQGRVPLHSVPAHLSILAALCGWSLPETPHPCLWTEESSSVHLRVLILT